jgi:hypothetical protein
MYRGKIALRLRGSLLWVMLPSDGYRPFTGIPPQALLTAKTSLRYFCPDNQKSRHNQRRWRTFMRT